MKYCKIYILILSVLCMNYSQAQSNDLEFVCQGDSALRGYLISVLTDGESISQDLLSADEKTEIQSVLTQESVVDGTNQEKFSAVMSSCANRQILNDRFSRQ